MKRPSRRTFLKHATVAAGSLIAAPMVSRGSVLGANDEIRVGIIGLGNRGGSHLSAFGNMKGVRIVALCDPDELRLDSRTKALQAKSSWEVSGYEDLRELIDNDDIDVVTVATMQYWHALPTIWACQAGKDVYCEKPLSHYIWEGEKMVAAARKYDRVVQVGTQARSNRQVHEAIKYIHDGQLGKINYITSFANKPRTPIGLRTEPLPIPPTLDYELWCGPARKEDIFRDRIQYDCSFTWNMGDGESCNQGIHEIDVARWVLGEEKLPSRVMSIGGRFCFNDAADVPNTQIIYYDFPTAPILYEVHNMRKSKTDGAAETFKGVRTDTCVHCEGGYVMVRSGFACDNDGKRIKSFPGGGDPFTNFIEAVRAGKREMLNSEIEVGHRSTAITHVGNISYRLGKTASPAEMEAAVAETPEFARMYDRMVKHLEGHDVDVNANTMTLGPWLEIDRDKGQFVDNEQANRMTRGNYRAPWVLPEEV